MERNSNSRKGPVVKVTSERKGSNPGGYCKFHSNDLDLSRGYFKYCFGSRTSQGMSFLSENQPVYEAITSVLANLFGLKTPPSYVLNNRDRNVSFDGGQEFSKRNHSGRDFYLISKIMEESEGVEESFVDLRVKEDSVYLEGLMISDVVNKRQNYLARMDLNNLEIFYLDVGCSFVRAVDGFLGVTKKTNNLICEKKKSKKIKKLKGKSLVPASGSGLINLERIAQGIGDLEIPVLNPHGTMRVDELIGAQEIEDIEKCMVDNFAKNISKFRGQGILVE